MKHFLFVCILMASCTFQSCKKGTSLSNTNLKEIYSSNVDLPQPQFKVFHQSQSTTVVYFRLNNQNLAYGLTGNTSELQANVKLSWELFDNYESTEIMDSGNVHFIDTIATADFDFLQGDLTLNCAQGKNYILKVKLMDVNSEKESIHFIQIDKESPLTHQNYLVTLKENNAILFRNYVYPNEEIIITANTDLPEKMIIKHYPVSFNVANRPYSFAQPPPFDFNNYTSQEIPVGNNQLTTTFTQEGIYHIVQDIAERGSGITLFLYTDKFPEVSSVDQLIPPLRYITSKKEFQKLNQYQDLKKASDDFWIRCGKDQEKSKKLIRGYYGRVAYANKYFTSFKEGWKTDRGSIYIIFGPPAIVYKSLTGESWTYGEESNYQSLTFSFNRNNNPFTDNDYTLARSSLYKNPYYRAADAWRQGKVESLDY